MNLKQLLTVSSANNMEARSLLDKKNQDYSHNSDVHSNFKEMAQICTDFRVDITRPEGIIEYHVLHKIHRIFKLINSADEPSNESVKDSAVDLENYMTLLYTYYTENKNIIQAHYRWKQCNELFNELSFKRKSRERKAE